MSIVKQLEAGRASLIAVVPFWGWVVAMTILRTCRWDHVAIALFGTALACIGARSRRLLSAVLPFGWVGLFYDAMRFVQGVGVRESTVHVCDLRRLEQTWFGISDGENRITLHDWIQPRTQPWLDVLAAVPYGAFLFVVLGYGLFLLQRDFATGRRFGWCFLVLNVVGFVTYHLYPAAPPWYFHRAGCVVDLTTAPSPGPSLLRVDAMLGVPYFASMYGRASDVFGAFPSLHVAYPTLMLVLGWSVHRTFGRALLSAFLLWTALAAIYLDHHWVVDVLGGASYATLVATMARLGSRFGMGKQAATSSTNAAEQLGMTGPAHPGTEAVPPMRGRECAFGSSNDDKRRLRGVVAK